VLVLVVVLDLLVRKAIEDEHDDDDDNGKTGVSRSCSSSSSSSILGSWSANMKKNKRKIKNEDEHDWGGRTHLSGCSCPGNDKANRARPVHGSCAEGSG
jgi:hypothetical protein